MFNKSRIHSSNYTESAHRAAARLQEDCLAIVKLIINFSLELFLMARSYSAQKRWIICIIHILILRRYYKPPPLRAPSCIRTHIHPHTHTHTPSCLAVMKYVHTVYSLINWGCRLRHKRLHKAIPCGYFSRFIFLTWKLTAEFLLSLSLPARNPSDSPAEATAALLQTGKRSE